MRTLLAVTALLGITAFAQTPSPSIAGVWKADLEKSKIPGPPNAKLTEYLSIIEEKQVVINRRTQEKGPELDDLTGTWGGPHGPERMTLSFLLTGKPAVRSYQGVPTEMTASWQGNTLTLTGETAGRPQTLKRVYELSPDGQTLTVTTTSSGGGHEMTSLVVMTKQPDSAGEPLRAPEEKAEAHFKNVKTAVLKDMPVSEFIDQMRYLSWALGKECTFCHVQDHFDSDDKKPKKTARDMIAMTSKIDADNFDNHPNVKCFTCHEGHNHPLSYPLFPDQIAAQQAQEAQQQQQQGRPAPPRQ